MSEIAKPVAVAGDWHGDVPWMRAVVDAAAAAGAELILHVGDLAVLWPGRDKGKFDRRLQQRLELRDMRLVFVDGNHDNHQELRLLQLDDEGLAPLRPRIRYLPRGARFTYAGLTIAGLGGAYSIDQEWRTAGKDWWPDEDVTDEDVDRLIAGGPTDILVTHDVPYGVRVKSDLHLPPKVLEASEATRARLRRAVDALRPASVFAGHWHQRVIDTIDHPNGEQTRVDVLDMNLSRDGNAVLVWPGNFPLRVEPLRICGSPSRLPCG
ncbi:metallophosphoesterase family protein [Arthrobacter sp. USHLN218]|uniref:metallophosphoesterase family protein n=1 Tax=Arthrobacter sp. USHLN218 TaxID=3081232 RepID=UPI0030197970